MLNLYLGGVLASFLLSYRRKYPTFRQVLNTALLWPVILLAAGVLTVSKCTKKGDL